jgi:hypothetical protein
VVVTEQQPDTAGDYGYDEAHDQTGSSPKPDDKQHQRYTTARPGGTSSQGEDYGYDEAHGF